MEKIYYLSIKYSFFLYIAGIVLCGILLSYWEYQPTTLANYLLVMYLSLQSEFAIIPLGILSGLFSFSRPFGKEFSTNSRFRTLHWSVILTLIPYIIITDLLIPLAHNIVTGTLNILFDYVLKTLVINIAVIIIVSALSHVLGLWIQKNRTDEFLKTE